MSDIISTREFWDRSFEFISQDPGDPASEQELYSDTEGSGSDTLHAKNDVPLAVEQPPTSSRPGTVSCISQDWSLKRWTNIILPSFRQRGRSYDDVMCFFDNLDHRRIFGPANPIARQWLQLSLRLMNFPGVPLNDAHRES